MSETVVQRVPDLNTKCLKSLFNCVTELAFAKHLGSGRRLSVIKCYPTKNEMVKVICCTFSLSIECERKFTEIGLLTGPLSQYIESTGMHKVLPKSDISSWVYAFYQLPSKSCPEGFYAPCFICLEASLLLHSCNWSLLNLEILPRW